MNLIADNLFSLLLGWTRSLFNSLWNMLTNNSAGFTGFLQRFWLPLIVILLVFGTLTDYVIWLVRWRPYYAWSAWFRKRMGQRRLSQTQNFMEDLDHSPLDLPEYQTGEEGDDRSHLMDEPVYFDFQPGYPQYGQGEQQFTDAPYQLNGPGEEPVTQFTPSLPWENSLTQGLEPESGTEEWVPQSIEDYRSIPQERILQNQRNYYQQLELLGNTNTDTAGARAEMEQTSPGSARRRRAGAKRQRGKDVLRSLKDTFFSSDEAYKPIDSLQSPVSQEDAFHKPYYPQNYTYREQQSSKSANDQAEQ